MTLFQLKSLRWWFLAGLFCGLCITRPSQAAPKLHFHTIPAPVTAEAQQLTRTSPGVDLGEETFAIGYHPLFRNGDRFGNETFGLLHDVHGQPLKKEDGSPRISNSNDFSSLLQADGQIFLLSQFEDMPAGIYLSELRQSAETGLLKVKRTRPLDLAPLKGAWNLCAGSVTPWSTHLASEEYEPNAAVVDDIPDRSFQSMASYMGGDPAQLNPYDYGWQLEARVDSFDQVQLTRHYAMGRFSPEVGIVMPDRKTVYITDDGNNTALFRFVADRAGDLSSGKLFAARWIQTSPLNGGSAELNWIPLGHADDATIKKQIDRHIGFDEIFHYSHPGLGNECPNGYRAINTRWQHECLRVRSGMEQAVSRLESRRYAALLGATTEFSKMEGVTYDSATNRLYIAMTSLSKGMEDNRKGNIPNDRWDRGGPNHIRLPYNPCGAVYTLELDEAYVAHSMRAMVTGHPAKDDPDNRCDTAGIANPDNLTFIQGQDTLIIAEDSSKGHRNNALWAYRVANGELTRIQTAPLGAEITGAYHFPDVNGWDYLFSVIQHPLDAASITGYIGPFPTGTTAGKQNQ
ncbi:MAG: alkaline phosphatase [endosymbiont of Escarpia spicata]|uniref:Alkaline phosphatase n=1 Tax=endosymbiont of Escarpia spicata TaxID=2200908 RepID=A0A370DSS6_9GAMM|nr:MAG: alkaline phosphatase [endosymbiont of Escarpia spicata]